MAYVSKHVYGGEKKGKKYAYRFYTYLADIPPLYHLRLATST